MPVSGLIFTAPIIANAIAESLAVRYNKKHFGGLKLSRKAELYKGNYLENIRNAIYAYKKSSDLARCTDKHKKKRKRMLKDDPFSDLEEMEILRNDEEFEKHMLDTPSTHEEQDVIEPVVEDIDINFPLEVIRDEYFVNKKVNEARSLGMVCTKDSDTMNYITAYSFIRLNQDDNYRMEAYAKLASSFGNNTKVKEQSENSKKISNYKKILQTLSVYGKKMKDGKATKVENEFFMSLLYYLGKDFDEEDVMDYLSDLYDEENNEEAKHLLKKAG